METVNAVDPPPLKQERFLRRLDWSAFWTAFALSFAVYFYTLAPTVTLEDSGELAVAGRHLGVPHPPGYPIWTIIVWLFSKVFAFVTYRGQPNPAWSIGLASAVFGAFASGFTSILICRSGRDMLRSMRQTTKVLGEVMEDRICWVAGVAGSLIFAFSSVNWSQAVINEIYSLNAFFLLLVMFLIYVWMRHPREKLHILTVSVASLWIISLITMIGHVIWLLPRASFGGLCIHYVLGILLMIAMTVAVVYAWWTRPEHRLLYLTAFVFGLGLTNYQVLLLLAASLVIVVLLKDLTLFRDFMIAGLPVIFVYVLCKHGFVPGKNVAVLPKEIPHTNWAGYAIAICLCLGAGGIWLWLTKAFERPLKLLRQFIVVMLPYACLAVLLWKKALVTTSIPKIEAVLPIISHPTGSACYTYFILALAGLALAYFFLPNGKAVAPTLVCLGLGLAVYIFMPLSSETNPPMNWGYPRTWEGFQHAISRGQYERIKPTATLAAFLQQIGDYLRDLRITFTLPLAILGFLPFTAWFIRLNAKKRLNSLYISVVLVVLASAFIFLEEIIAPATGEIAALTAVYRFLIALIILLMVAGGVIMLILEACDFGVRIWHDRADSTVTGLEHEDRLPFNTQVDSTSRKWTLVTTSGFMVMSLILIMLASPKGDIQDAFIQRVKFISSHALYAIWIGYGILFGLAFVDTLFRGNKAITWLGLTVAFLLPLIPINENWRNPQLLKIYGGAEQQGHDFGWQFGNYQLRGAEAIGEELDPDEEPLPNPEFPKEMGPDAIFFGGTDPGRFVPTYMIYGADVRPDVFLITQNALADNTYMSVMRDLYGDDIWIPAQQDSAKAFSRYVEEVRSGKRVKNAELKIEGGRVQVSGALGVMEINGILAQMIFEHNNYKHDFYVEESYVIRWMYPYLEPHGLIMKINADKVNLRTKLDTVRDDMDFWDWYSRRLLSSPGFVRDIVARKSFSKLRSAIAGLYANRAIRLDNRFFAQAEEAFQEARMLYPLSPEANFRLVQEVHMPTRRFDESKEVISSFGREDPGNRKVAPFFNQVTNFDNLYKQIAVYEKKYREKKLQIPDALKLIELYFKAQQTGMAVNVAKGVAATPNLPGIYYYRAGVFLQQGKQNKDAAAALDKAMALLPANSDAKVYLDVVSRYLQLKRPDRAEEAMQRYLRLKQSDWKAWIDLAVLQLQLKKQDQAVTSLRQAVQQGRSGALSIIQSDKRFAHLLPRLGGGGNQRSLMGLPGITPRNGGAGSGSPLGRNPLRKR